MLDVKAALEASDGDTDAAFDWLRKKGLSRAAKKADREAAEGLVGLASSDCGTLAVLVEVNSETDFVARNAVFQSLVGTAAAAALEAAAADGGAEGAAAMDAAALLASPREQGGTLADAVAEVAGQVGENVVLRRAARVRAPPGGAVAAYLHSRPEGEGAQSMGRIASAVALAPAGGAGPVPSDAAAGVGQKVAMHVAAARPSHLSPDDVPPEALNAERALLTEQAAATGKPANIVAKMVEGRMGKFYEEHCLVRQKFVMDDSVTVEKAAEGAGCAVAAFARIEVGKP